MNRCRECLAEVSPGAAHCPQCGRELGPPVTLPEPGALLPDPTGNWRILVIGMGVVGVLALLVVIGLWTGSASDEPYAPADQGNIVITPPPQPSAAEPVVVTAEELGKAYEENGLAAKDKFEGRPIRVTGNVVRVGSNKGEPTISLKSSLQLQAAFGDAAPLKALTSGQEVTITCEALAEGGALLALRNCALTSVNRERANPPDDRRTGPQ